MNKRCIYCQCGLGDKSIVELCERCGVNAFGAEMFKAIIANMEAADLRGDLDQSV